MLTGERRLGGCRSIDLVISRLFPAYSTAPERSETQPAANEGK